MIEEQTQVRLQATHILAQYREQVWPLVQRSLVRPQHPPAFEVPASYRREQDLHWSMVREYPKRQGKYLRPALLLLKCEAMGGDAVLARNTAAAMQLSEDWILIHDDLEDGSVEQRGKPTLHRMYGSALAINAGDALPAIMWQALFANKAFLDEQKTTAPLKEFFRMMSRTIEGQSAELQWVSAHNTAVTDSDCFFLNAHKENLIRPFEDRLMMCTLAAQEMEQRLTTLGASVQVSRMEEQLARLRAAPNSTLETLTMLQTADPASELIFLLRSDLVSGENPELRRWREPDKLVQFATLAICPRCGYPRNETFLKSFGHDARFVILDEVVVPDMAASSIKERLASGVPPLM